MDHTSKIVKGVVLLVVIAGGVAFFKKDAAPAKQASSASGK
ncbi:MAG: hypothetical protein WAT81_05000 [Candidatus Moraniibacteriota bacterium]